MRYRSMPLARRGGGPGWKTRRNLVFRVAGTAVAVVILVGSLLRVRDEPGGAAATILFALVLLTLAMPVRRPRRAPYMTTANGQSAVEIPMRALPLRVSLVLSAVGLLMLVGAMAVAWKTMAADPVRATVSALIGGGLGLVIGALGAVNLLPAARKPRPILLYHDGVSWVFGGERQWAGWEEIASIEARWTPVQAGRVRVTTNHIVLNGPDGEPVTSFRTALLAVDPESALQALREQKAAAPE